MLYVYVPGFLAESQERSCLFLLVKADLVDPGL